jgi:predicted nucleotidyltransferase
MNERTINRTVIAIQDIAGKHGYEIDRIIVYGSQARQDHTTESDIDLVIVSSTFGGIEYYARPHHFLWEWPRDELPKPDIVPLTPAEFEKRSRSDTDIVHTAASEGISVSEPLA